MNEKPPDFESDAQTKPPENQPSATRGIRVVRGFELLILLTGVVALLKDWGLYVITAAAFIFLAEWWYGGRATKFANLVSQVGRPRRVLACKYGFEPAIVVLVLLAAFIYGLPFTLGQPIYRLSVGNTIPIDLSEVQEVTDKFPATAKQGERNSQYLRELSGMRYWRSLVGRGAKVNGANLYLVPAKPFEDSYGDFRADYSLSSGYLIGRAFAFLESETKLASKDSRYRPVLRQMPTCILSNHRTVRVEIEQPELGERVLLFIQANKEGTTDAPVVISKCFTSDTFEVQ